MLGVGKKLCSISIDTVILHNRLIKFKTWYSVYKYDAQLLTRMLRYWTWVFKPSLWPTCPHEKSQIVQSTRSPHLPGQKPGQPAGSGSTNFFCWINFQVKLQNTRVSDFASVFGSTRKPPIESHSSSASAHESACKYWNVKNGRKK